MVYLAPVRAETAGTIIFSIAPQPLSSAVIEFSRQANVQILTAGSRLTGVNTKGVSGRYSLDAGIKRLLVGTRFGYQLIGSDTISLIPPPDRKMASSDEDAGGLPHQRETPDTYSAKPGRKTSNSEVSPALQEVVVTAQKYLQAAYNVPIALTVVNGSALQRLGVMNLEDLQYQVPGLFVQSGGSQRRIYLDGVANQNGNGALVSEYLDDADVTASPNLFAYSSLDLRTYDLARVEVLRGPQGTLYGEGAEGGAIHYVTNPPDLHEFEFGIKGEVLFTKEGAPSQEVLPLINIPVVPGLLGIRVSGEYSNEGGWIDQPVAQRENINNADLADTRIELLWQPSNQFKLNMMETIHRKSFGLNYGADSNEDWTAAPFDLDISPHERDHYEISNIKAQYTLPGTVELVNSATYIHDANFSPDLGYIDPFDEIETLFYNHYTFSTFSDEFRFSNEGVAPSSPWRWTAGGMFKHVLVSNYPSGFCLGFTTSVAGTDALISSNPSERVAACNANPESLWINIGSDLKSKQYSEFGDVNYKILDRFTVGLGARYFKDHQDHLAAELAPQSASFTSTDPRAYALYGLTDKVNVYASAAKGFRSGGFNTVGAPPFDPESLWYYDFGVKTHGLEMFEAAADVFYGDYTNFQSPGLVNHITVTLNGGIVHTKGLDATVQWRPWDGWRVGIDGEYTDARVVSTGGFTGTPQLVGELLNWTLRYQLDATVERDFSIEGKRAYVALGYSQRPGLSYDYRPGVSTYSQNLYIMNLAGRIQWNDNLAIGATVENGLDDRGYLDPQFLYNSAAREGPLTAGVYMDVRF